MTFLVLLGGIALVLPFVANAALYWDRRRALRNTCDAEDPLPWTTAAPAFFAECVALIVSSAAGPLGPILPRPPVDREANHLVILVPGYGLRPGSHWLLERRLRLLGWDTVSVGNTFGRRPPLRAAKDLGTLVLAECASTSRSTVSILAFGCAGLLVRRWLQDEPTAPVQQVITLGTPHQGTLGMWSRLARFRFVQPSSSFLHHLGEQDRIPRRFDTIAISSEFDAWAVPNDAAYYPGAFNIIVRNVGHFGLLLSKRIIELLAENLRTASGGSTKVLVDRPQNT